MSSSDPRPIVVHRLRLDLRRGRPSRLPAGDGSGPWPVAHRGSARLTSGRPLRGGHRACRPRHSRWATRPVQPVWCEAPRPAPVSPWKYSWKAAGRASPGPSGSARSRHRRAAGRRRPGARSRRAGGRGLAPRRAGASAGRSRSGTRRVKSAPNHVVPAVQRLDDQVVEREPDRAAPVGVAAEHPGRRLARLVVDDRASTPSTSSRNGSSRCRRETARMP